MPNWPVAGSRAMIDQVICCPSAPGGVALHAAWIGGGAAAHPDARGRGQPPLGPVRSDFDDMSALTKVLDRCLGNAILDHEHAGPCGARPERDREMLG